MSIENENSQHLDRLLRAAATAVNNAVNDDPDHMQERLAKLHAAAQTAAPPAADLAAIAATPRVLAEVGRERVRQNEKFGEQNHPDLIGDTDVQCDRRQVFTERASYYREINDSDMSLDWTGVLLEEVYEALAETDPAALRTELLQVAAVAVAWVEAIDRRTGTEAGEQA